MSQLRLGFALVFKALLMGLCVFTIKPAEAQKYVLKSEHQLSGGYSNYLDVDIDGSLLLARDGLLLSCDRDGTIRRSWPIPTVGAVPISFSRQVKVLPNGNVIWMTPSSLIVLNNEKQLVKEVISNNPSAYQLFRSGFSWETLQGFGVDENGRILVSTYRPAPSYPQAGQYLLTFSSSGDFLYEEKSKPASNYGNELGGPLLCLQGNQRLFVSPILNLMDSSWNVLWQGNDPEPWLAYLRDNPLSPNASNGNVIQTKDLFILVNNPDSVTGRIIILAPNFRNYEILPVPNVRSMIDIDGCLYAITDTNKLLVFAETTPPNVFLSTDIEASVNQWTNRSVNLEITGADNYAVTSIEYRLGVGSWSSASGSLYTTSLKNDGWHEVSGRVKDNSGNYSAVATSRFGIDTVKPVTVSDIQGNKLSISASDSLSGVKAIYTLVEGGIPTVYTQPIPLPANGMKVIYWAEDNASNVEVAKSYPPADGSLAISSFSTSPQSSVGGRTISSTISLSTAQSTPTTINLQSDNASVVVPASVTIDAGQTSKTFTIETKPVGAYTQTNITATLGTQTRTAQLDLFPPTARIRISPPVVSSESTAKATITLSGNAPTGGLVVELESDESAASVPNSITVAEGQKTATFNIVAGKVTEETYAYITATIDGVSSEASLTIRPKSIKPTTLSITESLVGGANGSGSITLSDPAPEGGLDVDLATNNAAVSLPLVVKIAAGSKTASFTFSTSAVSSTITATVSAKANGATVTDTIEVRVRPLGTLVASPSTLPGKAAGTLTLTLSSPTATPLTVNVTSSNAAVVLASKTIIIAKGQSSGILKFTTALVGTDTTSTITCSANGLEAKTDITVRSAKPSNVTLLPAVVLGGKGSVGTVTIDSAAPTSGLTVALSSSDSSAVVPSFVLVPSGKTSATFTITTSKVTSSKNVTITAQANGVSKTATLGVRILTIASISFNPVSVEGGVKANGLLTLTDVAPLGGMTVTLGSDKAGVTVPSTVLVPAGKSTAAFVASTSLTGSSYDAKITGTANGETGSGTLKVLAPAVSSFALSSTSVKGGDKPLGTVKIAKASSVDVVVSLSSSNAAIASLPASITIPKGQLLATFQVTTTKPSVSTSVTLSATTGGLAKVVVLKVNP